MICCACGQEKDCGVYASSFLPVSDSYCDICLEHGAIGHGELVFPIGRFRRGAATLQDLERYSLYSADQRKYVTIKEIVNEFGLPNEGEDIFIYIKKVSKELYYGSNKHD